MIKFESQWSRSINNYGYYSFIELAIERYQDMGEKRRMTIIICLLGFYVIIDF